MLSLLQQYEEHRNKMPLAEVLSPDSFFFISPMGKPLAACTVLRWFKKVLKKCRIPYLGDGKGPRIHDLRHTAATHSLIKMVEAGMDIYCALPILSVFLGHKTINGTEQYVRLTQEMYPEILKMEQSVTSFVFPKTNLKIDIDYENN
jgi:integrase